MKNHDFPCFSLFCAAMRALQVLKSSAIVSAAHELTMYNPPSKLVASVPLIFYIIKSSNLNRRFEAAEIAKIMVLYSSFVFPKRELGPPRWRWASLFVCRFQCLPRCRWTVSVGSVFAVSHMWALLFVAPPIPLERPGSYMYSTKADFRDVGGV